MSSGNTETRILQMQLENRDFEEGVRQTIKSLESLEEKLDLKNAGNGFEKVSAAANSVQMGHLEDGLDKVTNKFTLMGQIGLQVLERISSKVVDFGEKILRSATIQPMIDGWGEFEMKTGSIQTILGGIRNNFEDQPSAIRAISGALDELNEYADKTIYNFAQMTENVGKFTNQGISLEDSTNAIKGIANWAAAVGANPAQMSRAMYNISQSLGAGSMQLIDWRSIRFANMATPEVKKLFAEVAKIQGTLTEDGKVKIGKKTLDVLEDFESSLKGGWLTNEVMAEAFSIYANAYSETELIQKYGETLGKQFYEMGVYAEEAATKVRTFTQLIGVLKESLGSGWANTFDILLGGFEQQTEFLTAFKDKFEEIINFQTEDRNTWLQNFSDIGGIVVFQDTILKTLDILSDFYWVFNDVAALVLNPFGQSVFNMSDGIFGPRQEGYKELQTTWQGVKGVFDDISATLDKFRTWLYTPNKNGRSPIHNLASALSGVAGAAGIAWQVLTGFGKLVFRLAKRFAPLVSSVLDLLGQIGGVIYNIFFNLTGQQTIEGIFDKIESAIGPVLDIVVGLASAVVDLIHSFLGIDKAADDWTVLGDRMKAFWDIFKYDPELDFADNIRNSVKNALITVFGKDTAESLITAWDTNIAPVLESISTFFTQAFGDLNKVLEGLRNAAAQDYSQGGVKEGAKTFLRAFLEAYYPEDPDSAEETFNNVLGVYREIKTYYDTNVAPYVQPLIDIFTVTLPGLNAKIVDFLFGEEKTANLTGPGQVSKFRSGGLLQTISDYFTGDSWKQTWESIEGTFNSIFDKIKSIWGKFYDFLFGEEKTANLTGPGQVSKFRSGGLIQTVKEFFEGETWASIQETFNSIIQKIQDLWNKLNETLFTGYDETVAVYDGGRSKEVTHHPGLFESIWNYFRSQEWDENWKFIKSTFGDLYTWITDTGSQIWDTIMDFLFGPDEMVSEKQSDGKTVTKAVRSGGVYQDVVGYLSILWDDIREIVTPLYEYVTNHDFEEMWNDLNKLLFGYDKIANLTGPGQVQTYHVGGILTPIIDMLKPISDIFNMGIEKIGAINWGKIWDSIGKFFTGYDELVVYDGGRHKEIVHHESIFEKIANFFDRIITYFQSPEFQEFAGKVKSFFEPIINWISGLGGELWTAIQGLFSGQGFGAFGNVGDYLTGGINSLLDSLFPKQDAADGAATGTGASSGGGFNFFEFIQSLLFGTASADEVTKENDAQTQAIVATLDQTEKQTSTLGDILSKIPDNLLKLTGPVLAIFGMSAANKLLYQITGKEKKTFLDRFTELFEAIGGILQGMGILIGAVALSERISPNSIDKAFDKVKDLMWHMTAMLGVIGGASWGLDLLGEFGEAKIASKFTNMKQPNQLTSVSQNIMNFAEAFKNMMSGVEVLIDDVLKISFFEKFVDLDKGVDKVTQLITKVFEGLLAPTAAGTGLSALFGLMSQVTLAATDSMVIKNGGLVKGADGSKTLQRSKATVDSFSSTMSGIASLFLSVSEGMSSIITAAGWIIPLIPEDKFKNVLEMIRVVGEVIGNVVGGLNILTTIKSVGKVAENFSILGINKNNAQDILNKNPSNGGGAFMTAIKTIGVFTVAVAALELLAGLGLWIIQMNIDSYSKTIYRAMALVKNVLNMINSISSETTSSAQSIVETSGGVLATVAQWSWTGNPTENAAIFRKMGVELAIGLEALSRATTSYQTGKVLEAFKDLNEAWIYIRFDEGGEFDVNDFQGKISFLERAGQGFESMASSFRRIKQTDVDSLSIVKTYASELNTISATLAGVSAFNAFTGFNGKSFVETLLEMSRIGHVIKDESGEVRGLEELDGEKIRGYFNEILIALPDDPQLLKKLEGFTAAGGSNIGLFATGLLSLNEALSGYRDVMLQLDDKTFTSDTNVLGAIDKLGQKMTGDYDFLGSNTAQNMNTRLGIFATDLKTLAGSFGLLVQSTRDQNGNDFNLKPIEDLLNTINLLGQYVNAEGWSVNSDDNLGAYSTNFATIASSVEGLISTIHNFQFNTSDLKPVGDFLTQVAGIEQILTTYKESLPDTVTGEETGIHDLDEHASFVTKSALWLNDFVPLMSVLGQGIHDLWTPISGDGISSDSLTGVGGFLQSVASAINEMKLTTPDEIGAYTAAFNDLKKALIIGEENTIATSLSQIFSQTEVGEVQVRITPVLGDTKFGPLADGLQLDNTYSRMITMSVNMNDIQKVQLVDSQVESLVKANNETRDKIDTLAKSISQMRIQIDPIPGRSGPRRSIETYPLVANYQAPYTDEP